MRLEQLRDGNAYERETLLNRLLRENKIRSAQENVISRRVSRIIKAFQGKKRAPQSGAKTGLGDKDMSRSLPQKEHLGKL